jgi:hypothetical protein
LKLHQTGFEDQMPALQRALAAAPRPPEIEADATFDQIAQAVRPPRPVDSFDGADAPAAPDPLSLLGNALRGKS